MIFTESIASEIFSTNKTRVQVTVFDWDEPVVITFSMMGKYAPINIEESCELWGHSFLAKKKINVISFECIEKAHWYLDENLPLLINEMLEPILCRFPERLGYGGSMGGFGLLAFHDLLKINRLLVVNPITTLDENKVSFETRFKVHRKKLNWNFEFSDIAPNVKNGYVIFDPLFELDKRHAHRIENLEKIKLYGLGHSLPLHLQKMKFLTWLFLEFYNNTLNVVEVLSKEKRKRNYLHYYKWLLSNENKYLTSRREQVIERYYLAHKVKLGLIDVVPKGVVEGIRDYAIKKEDSDIELSLNIMQFAHMLRPDGPFINRKINLYQKLLDRRKS